MAKRIILLLSLMITTAFAEERIFNPPIVSDTSVSAGAGTSSLRIDRCKNFGNTCDKAAADYFCTQVKSSLGGPYLYAKTAPATSNQQVTLTLGTKQVCTTGLIQCKALNSITCVKGSNPGVECSANSDCLSNYCKPYWAGKKYCVSDSSKECGQPNTNGNDAGHRFNSSNGQGVNVCTETSGYDFRYFNGQPCGGDSDCDSGRCRRYTGSTAKFCVAANKECGLSGSDGFDIGNTIIISNEYYECKGTDPNAQFEKIAKKANGQECISDQYCTSGRCKIGGSDNSKKYCVASGKDCGWPSKEGSANNETFIEYIYAASASSTSSQVNKVYKCTSNSGFIPLSKTEYNCPTVVKSSPVSSTDSSKFTSFPTKKEFKDVPFYQIYLNQTILRCYYGYGAAENQVGFLELSHGAGGNCFPKIPEGSTHLYSKTRQTVSCWK